MKDVTFDQYAEANTAVRDDVTKQVINQIEKWGLQRHTFPEWEAIFNEEFAEFKCKVITAKETGYEELMHVVAVGIAWMIDIKLKEKNNAKI
ncbi:hypothetical protein ES703_58354 [subsurface metagenome]